MSTTVCDTQSFLEKAIAPKPPVLPPDTALKVTIAPIYGPGASCIVRDFESTGQRKAAIGCPQQVSLRVRLWQANRLVQYLSLPAPAPSAVADEGGYLAGPIARAERAARPRSGRNAREYQAVRTNSC